jgi:formate hydrogenlyase subunit 3/multisubunit Na+/H+ antiporter MnhD subunit
MSALIQAMLFGVAALLGAGLAGAVLARRPLGRRAVYGLSLVASTALLGLGLAAIPLGAEGAAGLQLPLGLPRLGAHFRLDALSGYFALVANLGGAAASLYGLGYGRHEAEPQRVLPFYPLFLAGVNLVLLADDAFVFLLAWEFMSLASWALVMAHHRSAGNAQAGFIYLVMANLGTGALLLAFGLLAGAADDYGFAAMRTAAPSSALSAAVLFLALFGAGSKAGLVPLHAWLPLAHPAAPSHVSALMSGVMTKVAIYGLIRIVMDLAGEPAWWWSVVVLALGGITALLGVLYALMQHDLKRLLAYHTVENIGIIVVGIGLALAFRANGLETLAALGLGAALLHVLNHMLFKSLLFFGAGAILDATGVRDMERLGGLLKLMPLTGLCFLVGSAAISALPPLNGFASEWLLFQAIMNSPALPQWLLKFTVPIVGALLALSAALAAACFVKAFGISFLGRARSAAAATAREAAPSTTGTMLGFALLCGLIGIFPGALVPLINAAVGVVMPGELGATVEGGWLWFQPLGAERSSYSGLVMLIGIALVGGLVVLAIHRLASNRVRRADPWDCGFPDADPATQYTAASFAQPIRRAFGSFVFRARETVEMPNPRDTAPARFALSLLDPAWEAFYRPVERLIGWASERANVLPYMTIRRYLSFVFVALVVLLVLVAVFG